MVLIQVGARQNRSTEAENSNKTNKIIRERLVDNYHNEVSLRWADEESTVEDAETGAVLCCHC